MRRAILLSLTAALAISVSGCGRPSIADRPEPASATGPISAPGLDDGDPKWSNPIAGVPVTIQKAQAEVLFTIMTPQGLGSPDRVFVSDPSVVPESVRVVALVYHPARFGEVVIEEHLPDVPVDQYDAANGAIVAQAHAPYAHGTARLVRVRGVLGLLTANANASESTLWWLEVRKFEIIVRGPSLKADQAMAVANLPWRVPED